jgi:alanine racemase
VRLNALPQVDEITLMTHFAHADDAQGVAEQLACFHACTHDLQGERSLANSAAVLRHGTDAAVLGDWVRPGIALYGSAPDHPLHSAAHWGLLPAMSLRRYDIVERLLVHHADLKMTDQNGKTIKELLLMYNDDKLVKLVKTYEK